MIRAMQSWYIPNMEEAKVLEKPIIALLYDRRQMIEEQASQESIRLLQEKRAKQKSLNSNPSPEKVKKSIYSKR